MEQKIKDFLSAYPDIKQVELVVADLNAVQRGKRYAIDVLPKVARDGFFMPLSIAVCDIFGSLGTVQCLIDEKRYHGDPDYLYRVLPESLRAMETGVAQIFVRPYEEDGTQTCPYDPRTILESVLSRYESSAYTPIVAFEIEFYFLEMNASAVIPARPPLGVPHLVGQQPLSLEAMRDAQPMIEQIEKACKRAGVGLAGITSEFDTGQFEANFLHQGDVIKACEEILLFRQIIKTVARAHGFTASVMAKPMADRSGSGMHIHASILNDQGDNIFSGNAGRQQLEYAIGGMLTHMPASMAFFAPHSNSYRRFVKDNFAPVQADWGECNRHVALRIPAGLDEKSRRFEHRVAGADANPFLVMASVLAAAYDGMIHKIKPKNGPVLKGMLPPQVKKLPLRWKEALQAMEEKPFLDSYFTKAFIELYHSTKIDEELHFHRTIMPEEISCYLRLF